MQSVLLFALALVIRSLPSVDGTVDVVLEPGQGVVSAYSADFESVWHHAVPTTVVDRLEAARSGRVKGLGPTERLVLALSDERLQFDASRPLKDKSPCVFPYAPDLVRAYEYATHRSYVRDMMVVVVPFLGSQGARAVAVAELYETLFDQEGRRSEACRSFGTGTAGAVLVITGRARTWSWLERCSGDDGVAYAERLAEKGWRVDLSDRSVLANLIVDADGFVRRDACRYETLVLRHLSRRDAEAYRQTFGSRLLKTKVFATDTPVLYGAELTVGDPDLR